MGSRGRSRGGAAVTFRSALVAVVLATAACSGGDDTTGTESDPTASVDAQTTAEPSDTAPAESPATAGEGEGADAASTGDAAGDSARLDALTEDPQALCDALDQDAVRSAVGDFVELRPDDLAQDDRNLCQAFGDRFPVGAVWVFRDGSEREFLQTIAADPFEPCRIGGFDAACQTHTGDPELFNGWPTVSIPVGSMALEFDAPDPDDAEGLATALVDDLTTP